MALVIRSVSRATQPHLPSLAATLAPLLAVANAGSFHLSYQSARVLIEQGSFAGCDLTAIDAAVAAAPVQSDLLDVKAAVDALPTIQKAILLSIIDAINVERAQHGRAAITPAMALASIKAKADSL